MDCTINRVIADAEFDAVDVRTCAALTGKGLGVLTEIDAIATMKTIKKAELIAVPGEVRALLQKVVEAV